MTVDTVVSFREHRGHLGNRGTVGTVELSGLRCRARCTLPLAMCGRPTVHSFRGWADLSFDFVSGRSHFCYFVNGPSKACHKSETVLDEFSTVRVAPPKCLFAIVRYRSNVAQRSLAPTTEILLMATRTATKQTQTFDEDSIVGQKSLTTDSGLHSIDDTQALPTTPAKLSARSPKWMRCPELAEASEQIEPQQTNFRELDSAPLKAITRVYLRTEIGFMTNAEFSTPDVGNEIFAGELQLESRQSVLGIAAIRKSGVDLPIHLSRLCEAPLLKPEQERELFRRMNFLFHQASVHRSLLRIERPSRSRLELIDKLVLLAEWHRDRIVEANLRLVFSIVKKFVNAENTFDDLLSDGIVGLIRAVEKFDYDRGFRFSTYATQVVRRNSYRTVVLRQQERQTTIGGLQDLNLDLTDTDRSSAISEKRWHELRRRLALMLDDLDRREKFIIRARFSLGSHRKVHTLQSLADRLGISKERVRQLERRAMEKLRGMAGDNSLGELEPEAS